MIHFHLINTLTGLTIIYTAINFPVIVWILLAFYGMVGTTELYVAPTCDEVDSIIGGFNAYLEHPGRSRFCGTV